MRMRVSKLVTALSAMIAVGVGTAATAQYNSGFESLNPGLLTGQDEYYIPPNSNSVDFTVETYAGTSLPVPAHPSGGGTKFIAGVGPGSPTFARAQRDICWGTNQALMTYDACAFYLGNDPSQNNLGSVSVQPYPGSASYIHLFSFVDEANTSAGWNAFYLAYNADGSVQTAPGESPGPEWGGLDLESWYRFETLIDFGLNQIIEVSITDLSTGDKTTATPSNLYLQGGSAGGQPIPTGFRFFGGGGVPDNGMAYDNISILVDSACPPILSLEGFCPGRLTASVTDATPNGQVAFIYGSNQGRYTNPNNPCMGTVIDIRPPFLPGAPRIVRADANGEASLTANASANLCLRTYIQVVDLDTCTVSNRVFF
ncbi:MAG: hypothetical protein ACF8PN_01380 [Phycisphaerales bacterium]